MEELKVANDTTQFIVIRLGDEQYGIDIKYIDNILRMQKITRVPKVAPYLLPVMSIRIKMGLEEDIVTKSSRIIVIKMEQQGMIGIIVDEVKEVVTLETAQIEKVAYASKDEKDNFIYGIGKYEGGLISLLDLNLVVPENS